MVFSVAVALAIWAAGVFLSSTAWGAVLACSALAALLIAATHGSESARLGRLARKEQAFETDLAARIQRRGFDSCGNLML